MKPKHQRLVFVLGSLVFLCVSALLTLRAFRDNLVFFYTPSDAALYRMEPERLVRLGGLVKTGSLSTQEDRIRFVVTDGSGEITVTYRGMLPSLFREGQGVVAEGSLKDRQHFEASKILAKHDETYMPKEVSDALKRSGHWKGEKAAP